MPPLERPDREDFLPERVGRLAMIARWKPVHLGHASVLRALQACADRVVIGIGSSNRYDARNPWTAAETEAMLRCLVGEGPEILPVPDLGDGPRWRKMVLELLGPLDLFVTANRYVRDLLAEDYLVVHPVHLVPPAERVALDATMVRQAMARGEDWRTLVPPEVAAFLDRQGLVERFRREFGGEYR